MRIVYNYNSTDTGKKWNEQTINALSGTHKYNYCNPFSWAALYMYNNFIFFLQYVLVHSINSTSIILQQRLVSNCFSITPTDSLPHLVTEYSAKDFCNGNYSYNKTRISFTVIPEGCPHY